MPKFQKIILATVFLFTITALTPLVQAAPAMVVPVEINAQTYDPIGNELIKQTTDLFKSNSRFQLANSKDTGKLIIRISTMEYQPAKDPVKIIAYSLAVTAITADNFYPHYISSTVGICNAKEVPADAKAILNDITKLIDTQPELITSIVRPREK